MVVHLPDVGGVGFERPERSSPVSFFDVYHEEFEIPKIIVLKINTVTRKVLSSSLAFDMGVWVWLEVLTGIVSLMALRKHPDLFISACWGTRHTRMTLSVSSRSLTSIIVEADLVTSVLGYGVSMPGCPSRGWVLGHDFELCFKADDRPCG